MKKAFLLGLALLFSLSMSAQHFALKNNLLYDATTTPNLGFEVGLSKKVTLDVSAGYNPFKFNDGKKLKHWLVMPEVRYWTCEKFNGTFIGVHALGGQYNIAGIKLPFGIFPNLKDHRYDGYLYGGGLTLPSVPDCCRPCRPRSQAASGPAGRRCAAGCRQGLAY